MTDDDILYHHRQRDPYMGLRMAKELHRGELKHWHSTAIQQKAEREAKEMARQQLRAKVLPDELT